MIRIGDGIDFIDHAADLRLSREPVGNLIAASESEARPGRKFHLAVGARGTEEILQIGVERPLATNISFYIKAKRLQSRWSVPLPIRPKRKTGQRER